MNENQMQHGVDWNGADLSGWVVTEKFDGCRGYWDGEQMWSRGGKPVEIPENWRTRLPPCALDGEIYFGNAGRSKCATAVRYGRFLPGMQFIAFDAPAAAGDYTQRLDYARDAVGENEFIRVAVARRLQNNEDVLSTLSRVVSSGGEGLMCRLAELRYTQGRTAQMVKVKHRWQAGL